MSNLHVSPFAGGGKFLDIKAGRCAPETRDENKICANLERSTVDSGGNTRVRQDQKNKNKNKILDPEKEKSSAGEKRVERNTNTSSLFFLFYSLFCSSSLSSASVAQPP